MPPGVTFHVGSWTFRPGDDVPPELESRLPEEVRIKAGKARAVPEPEAKADDSIVMDAFSPSGRKRDR